MPKITSPCGSPAGEQRAVEHLVRVAALEDPECEAALLLERRLDRLRDRERVVRDEHDLRRRLAVAAAAGGRSCQRRSEERRGTERERATTAHARLRTAAAPGRIARRTPVATVSRASVPAKTFETPRLEPGSSVSAASGYSRPSVTTPVAAPPRARSVRSSPGCPAIVRSPRRTWTTASPTSASSSARRSAPHRAGGATRRGGRGGRRRSRRRARAARRERPPRPGRARGRSRPLPRVADRPACRRFRRGERRVHRIEVADATSTESPSAAARSRPPSAATTAPVSGTTTAGPPPEATTTTSGSITRIPPLALPRSGSAGRRRGSRPLSPVAPSSRFARHIVVERMAQASEFTDPRRAGRGGAGGPRPRRARLRRPDRRRARRRTARLLGLDRRALGRGRARPRARGPRPLHPVVAGRADAARRDPRPQPALGRAGAPGAPGRHAPRP